LKVILPTYRGKITKLTCL